MDETQDAPLRAAAVKGGQRAVYPGLTADAARRALDRAQFRQLATRRWVVGHRSVRKRVAKPTLAGLLKLGWKLTENGRATPLGRKILRAQLAPSSLCPREHECRHEQPPRRAAAVIIWRHGTAAAATARLRRRCGCACGGLTRCPRHRQACGRQRCRRRPDGRGRNRGETSGYVLLDRLSAFRSPSDETHPVAL